MKNNLKIMIGRIPAGKVIDWIAACLTTFIVFAMAFSLLRVTPQTVPVAPVVPPVSHGIIRRDLPADIPVNPHPAGSKEWAEWIGQMRDDPRYANDPIVIVQEKPTLWVWYVNYPGLYDYRGYFDRGYAYWFRLNDVLEISGAKKPEPIRVPVRDPDQDREIERLRERIKQAREALTI